MQYVKFKRNFSGTRWWLVRVDKKGKTFLEKMAGNWRMEARAEIL